MYGVIMAGGRGARFWPRSRAATPKQLLDIIGEKTMIQQTVERISGIISSEQILIVTGRECADDLQKQLPDIPKRNILIEPAGRNTAPCICLAALWIYRESPDSAMAVIPSDHYIKDPQKFRTCLIAAHEAALEHDSLVAIGIKPERPETGYGYIQINSSIEKHNGFEVYRAKAFHEKPSREKAQKFLQQGNFLWNSGIFVWKAATILREIKIYLPSLYDSLLAVEPHLGTPKADQALAAAYDAIEAISIDFGVMEKAETVLTLKGNFGWNDMGSWSALHEVSEKDKMGNVVNGEVIAVDAHNILAYSPKKLTAVVGLKDVVIVETDDALLVCARDKAQDVKKIVEYLEQQGKKEYL